MTYYGAEKVVLKVAGGNRYTYTINSPVEYIDPVWISATAVNMATMAPSGLAVIGRYILTPVSLDKNMSVSAENRY